MISVNTLGEVPNASGYIIELGMEGTKHVAESINRDEIRDEMGLDEWYVRTGDRNEEQDLMGQIDQEIDHTRLPAFLILGSHPENATDGAVIYLDGAESSEDVWEALEVALSEMRELNNADNKLDMEKLAEHLSTERAILAVQLGASAVQYIQFAT
jgi:hypothetical protein